MTKNELAINNWVRHRDQGEKPYRITSITIDGDKYLYTAEGLTSGDSYVDVRAAVFEPIALSEDILKLSGYVQMINPVTPDESRAEKHFSLNTGVGIGALIEISRHGHYTLTMAGSNASFLTKRVKYLHELQNLCKSFDMSIVNVNWLMRFDEVSENNEKIDNEDINSEDIPVICQ